MSFFNLKIPISCSGSSSSECPSFRKAMSTTTVLVAPLTSRTMFAAIAEEAMSKSSST